VWGTLKVGSSLACKHYTRLERLAKDMDSSLLQKSVNYGRKKFYNIDTWGGDGINGAGSEGGPSVLGDVIFPTVLS
jgi:hypothetical protein